MREWIIGIAVAIVLTTLIDVIIAEGRPKNTSKG